MKRVITCDNISPWITIVEINESIQDKLDRDIKLGLFTKEVRDLIAYWIIEIGELGYEDYIISSLARSFIDHELEGYRQGERSIHLNTIKKESSLK